jgi:5,10-methylenetetrahydromethanopterin reductase
MDFGIAFASTTESWRVAQRAEELGFTHAWFYDTQLLNPDVFVCMALAAQATKRIRLGTGVLIPSNRLSPVAANGYATLSKLAPGRIDFGVGTGFTGRRTMGQGAIKLADFERYIHEVQALLRGETVEVLLEGEMKKVRFLNPDLGLIDISHDVPLHVSAFGPKARALTARLGAGWQFFNGSNALAISALNGMQETWKASGRTDRLYATLYTLGCVLEPGESIMSPRAQAQAGPLAVVLLHDMVERNSLGDALQAPPPIANAAAAYAEIYEKFEPADAKWLQLHRGHLMFVREEEKRFLNEDLMKLLTFSGTADDLTARVAELRDAGYSQFTVQIVEGQEAAIEDWARVLKPLGLGQGR